MEINLEQILLQNEYDNEILNDDRCLHLYSDGFYFYCDIADLRCPYSDKSQEIIENCEYWKYQGR